MDSGMQRCTGLDELILNVNDSRIFRCGRCAGDGCPRMEYFGILASADEVYGICLLHYLEKNRRPRRRGLRRQPFGLAPGLSHSVPLAARSDQSLSLTYVRDLLPQPLCGRIKRWAILFGNAKAAAASEGTK